MTTSVSEVAEQFRSGELTFHQRIEKDLFGDMLVLYENGRYAASAMIGAVLYEKMFTTRLIREAWFPYTPSKENVSEQLRYLRDREQEIIDGRKLQFKDITRELKDAKILTKQQKSHADEFYKNFRIPVLHGLSYRLYCSIFGTPPDTPFHIDLYYEKLYRIVAEHMIFETYSWVASRILLKQ